MPKSKSSDGPSHDGCRCSHAWRCLTAAADKCQHARYGHTGTTCRLMRTMCLAHNPPWLTQCVPNAQEPMKPLAEDPLVALKQYIEEE